MNYRECVGIVLIKRGLIFAGQRIDYKSDAWQMPQGGIELRETPRNAALRELKEETGISMQHIEILCETEDWVKYDLPKELVPKLWGGKFVGQKQKWFAMNFFGLDEDVNINWKLKKLAFRVSCASFVFWVVVHVSLKNILSGDFC